MARCERDSDPASRAGRGFDFESGVDPFSFWYRELRSRHLARASLAQIRRGVHALSTLYVERRGRLGTSREPFEGEARRAAFALYYAPLHFLTVRSIAAALGLAQSGDVAPTRILDLGCGTGAGAAALATRLDMPPRVDMIDLSPWAVDEARWTLRTLGLRGVARRGDVRRARLPGARGLILAAYAVNELDDAGRDALLERILRAHEAGASTPVIEPISRAVTPWWESWREVLEPRSGRSDDWRFELELPDEIEELDRGAGLDHRELTARSLWFAAS